jgi:hypothetical protein
MAEFIYQIQMDSFSSLLYYTRTNPLHHIRSLYSFIMLCPRCSLLKPASITAVLPRLLFTALQLLSAFTQPAQPSQMAVQMISDDVSMTISVKVMMISVKKTFSFL